MTTSQKPVPSDDGLTTFWALPVTNILTRLNTREAGLCHEAVGEIRQTIIGIVGCYVLSAEGLKHWFYRV